MIVIVIIIVIIINKGIQPMKTRCDNPKDSAFGTRHDLDYLQLCRLVKQQSDVIIIN